jgi:hypothetical protein
MASEVSICNMALGWLGQSPISDLGEASTSAELCLVNYDEARMAVLEEGVWSFAQRRFVLDKPVPDREQYWGGNFYFGLPGGILKVREVYGNPSATEELPGWTREGRYIVADRKPIYCVGTNNVTDPNLFSAPFRAALAARLAADLAIPITQSQTLQADMWALYEDKLTRAAVMDASESRRYATGKGTGRLSRARYR